MLRNDDSIMFPHIGLQIISVLNGYAGASKCLRDGVYEVGHFGSSNFMAHCEHYPELSINPYGVCDGIDDILSACPEIEQSERKFTITLTPVLRSNQEEHGWRWHKWGSYIGKQTPTCEYLRDEPSIDKVYVYHIYELVG